MAGVLESITDTVSPTPMPRPGSSSSVCSSRRLAVVLKISFAEAVVSQSIEPESGGDKDKLALALEVLQLEDPTFKVGADKNTGQNVMRGMGTLHLEVKRHRLERDFRLKVRVGKPAVGVREMLKAPRTVEGKVEKLGDRPAFAELKVSFTNFKSDRPVAVFNAVGDDNPTPVAFLAAAEKALGDALQTGEIGMPMMNAQARIFDAKCDPQLSTEDAFVAAAIRAYREGTQGNVQLLEPIMKVTVTTPQQFLGNITGDIAKRRGQIEAQNMSETGIVNVAPAAIACATVASTSGTIR